MKNISDETQNKYDKIEEELNELASYTQSEECKLSDTKLSETYAKMLVLFDEQHRLIPFSHKKRLKVKLIREIYEYGLLMRDLKVKSASVYNRTKTKLEGMFHKKLKKFKVKK
jgi:hypothetical protein